MGQWPDSGEYEIIKLSSTPIVAFASTGNAISRRKSIRMEDLARLPLVMREPGSKTRAKIEELARQLGIKLNIQIEAEGREAVREIVASGDGVGIVSDAEFGSDSRLNKITISDSQLNLDEALICLKERQDSRLIRSFMEVARETIN
ncbi:MAG: hypothetical protein GKR97_21220 [Rhizobiaceae bacterium]|nr:hypothetical protein [Rhizobiaceae bacterium]